MANFSIRVELHHSNAYEKLHEHMEAQGFTRTIVSSDGTTYHMLPGMYRFNGHTNANGVWDRARAALDSTGLNGAVFVDESVNSVWSGLVAVTTTQVTRRVGW